MKPHHSTWQKGYLSDILTFSNGRKRPVAAGNFPVYGGNGILDYAGQNNYSSVIIIGRVGAYCGSVFYEKNECWVSDNAIAAQSKSNADMQYCFYLLKSLSLNKRRIGTSQPLLTQEILNSIGIAIPSLQEQKKIGTLLSALDDKIELNTQINHNLEEQAKAIFKSWFVDFEPFQDGEFVDSELGKIPHGWKIGNLSDIADVTMGQSPKGDTYNEEAQGTVFYQGRAEFSDRFPQRRLFTTDPKRMAVAGDILLSVRAPVGDMNIANESCCIGRGLAAIHAKDGCQSFVFYAVGSIRGKLDKYNGEGTVFGCINKDALNEQKVIIPPTKVVHDFEKIVAPLDHQYLIGAEENIRLTQLRDMLLPKLMSGEIDVSEVAR